jgi:hypothetical protein
MARPPADGAPRLRADSRYDDPGQLEQARGDCADDRRAATRTRGHCPRRRVGGTAITVIRRPPVDGVRRWEVTTVDDVTWVRDRRGSRSAIEEWLSRLPDSELPESRGGHLGHRPGARPRILLVGILNH